MTQLNRTDLPAPRKSQLAASALVWQAEYGAKTGLAREFNVSRPTVYEAGKTASAILNQHFSDNNPDSITLTLDERQIERCLTALRVISPNSIRAIEMLLPIIYPNYHLSYGKIQDILVRVEKKAEAFNKTVDLSNINAGALDEMFSQGDPVLAGVDLDHGFLFSLMLCAHRGADDWADVLKKAKAQGLDLKTVVKDAAKGIAAGVTAVFTEAEQRDDCFHALYELGKALRMLEQRAYGAISREFEAHKRLDNALLHHRGGTTTLVQEVIRVQAECAKAIELYDRFEPLARIAIEAIESIDLSTGKIRSADELKSTLQRAAEQMMQHPDERCVKVGKYLYNRAPGLALYLPELQQAIDALAEEYGDFYVQLACLMFRLRHDLKHERRPWSKVEDERHLIGIFAMLKASLGEKVWTLLGKIEGIMQKRHRASSAIEGFNAALRPFLYVHKGVTSGFLELFKAYYNLRTRRWGRHKGTSAYEGLTGQPVEDWLFFLDLDLPLPLPTSTMAN